ncbi:DNA-directed RNA polymerase subunit beta [bacterium]|nr:MAG: DNA-directed RNA polymerase subunit beta [bacterium]
MNKGRVSLSTSPLKGIQKNLLESQFKSYRWLKEFGLKALFEEISPVEDYTGKSWEISFGEIRFGEPTNTFKSALNRGGTLDIPVYIKVSLLNKKTKEIKEQEIYLMDLPVMSERGTFAVSGNERSIVQQIVRSEGVLFIETKNDGQKSLYGVKVIPQHGKWYTFETNKQGVMTVKLLEGRPRIHLTTILRALGYSTDDMQKMFKEVDNGEISFIEATLAKDKSKSSEDAIIKIFQALRPEDSISIESARAFFNSLFFGKRRFYLGKVGRYQIAKKLFGKKLSFDEIKDEDLLMNKGDIVAIVRALIEMNNGYRNVDDIDHLSNRRIRGVGELIAEELRKGVLRMEKNLKDKMGTFSTDELVTPSMIVNARPISAAITQFFGSSEISRYMDQQNILSEIEAKRRITAGGPGGLTTESATISVRDIHYSHYSRIDPVETPEGPQVGIVSHMALYAKVNDFGFLEAPYRRVVDGKTYEEVLKKSNNKVDTKVDKNKMYVTEEIVYLDPEEEFDKVIAPADISISEDMSLQDTYVFCRTKGNYANMAVTSINFIDVVPMQIGGASISIVPFIMNDDSNRALMAANMQRQAVPLLKAESAIVGTGTERLLAEASGRAVFAEENGEVKYVDAKKVFVSYDKPVREYKSNITTKKRDILEESDTDVVYELTKFLGTNQNTCFDQQPLVKVGQKFKKGDILIQGPSMQNDEIALGTNLVAAYIPWYGYSFEDGIVVSERLVKEDLLTSIHIREYSQDIRETKLGNEEMTRDIPNLSDFSLRNLDEDGLVRVGSYVNSSDILVGIVAPKGEVEMSAEEKLLRVIFGESAKDVRDNSLRLPHGDKGIVMDVQVLDRNKGDKLAPGVLKQVKVFVAKTHKIGVGDKLTGRHGDKGIITKVLPQEDMPFLEDGTPVDIVLNTLSIVRRMNLGQLHEAHLGYAASKLGVKVSAPIFSPIDTDQIYEEAKKKGYDALQKVKLYDGRTGEPFDNDIVVGIRYMMKLDHLAEDKIHARSVGAYTIVTQQPLGGKAQFGGQRFGEMEVWALEAHAVPYLLHETLTTRSDDVVSRVMAYRAIITGAPIPESQTTASFGVLQKELAALALNLTPQGVVQDKIDVNELVETGGLLQQEENVAKATEENLGETEGMEVKEGIEEMEAL